MSVSLKDRLLNAATGHSDYGQPAKRQRFTESCQQDDGHIKFGHAPKDIFESRIDLPEGTDVNFIQDLFGKTSSYPASLYDETGCIVTLNLGEGLAPTEMRSSIVVRGDSDISIRDAVERVHALFIVQNPSKRTSLVQQFALKSSSSRCDGDDIAQRLEIMRMESSKISGSLADDSPAERVPIPSMIATHLMTATNKRILQDETKSKVEWDNDFLQVLLFGSKLHVSAALKLLQRVISHCTWGSSEDKIARILKPKKVDSVRVRLSPMSTLPACDKRLSASAPTLSIGKDKEKNGLVISDSMVSRQHCIIEFDANRGAVYIIDGSTNGTFLNGKRLPSKLSGKVILSHGDDLVLRDPSSDPSAAEFGYMVNITEGRVEEEFAFAPPRRLVSMHDQRGKMNFYNQTL